MDNSILVFEGPPAVADTCDIIRRDGICVIKNYITTTDEMLSSTMDILHGDLSKDYPFGKVVRELGNELKRHIPDAFDVVAGSYPISIATRLGMPRLDAVFATHDFENAKGIAPNGYLHFDKIHTLKFMLYLTNCDASSGAFSVVPKSHNVGAILRNKDHDVNKIPRSGSALSRYHDELVPIESGAGTLIIFTTDLFHCGGRVEHGKERVIIRSHFR